jgi:hypothetical protein
MDFGYFYEEESEGFCFYRIPKALFTEECFGMLSTDAKVLYGLFLERVSLSKKNHWIDEQGRVYVYYTLLSIQRDLHCACQKAVKLLGELEEYGLIERVKQGQGKPTRIYVKNFIVHRLSQVQTCENHKSRTMKITSLDFRKSLRSNTDINNTDLSNPDLIYSENREDTRQNYYEYFMDQLDIAVLKERYPYETGEIDEIFGIILDTVCTNQKYIYISGDKKPADIVKSSFLKLESKHIEFVMDGMKSNTTQIRNMKKYLVAALYNASLTINNYYQSLVRHDLATGRI